MLDSCSISAPVDSYAFVLPEYGNDYELTKVEDLEIRPSDKLQAFMDAHHIKFSLEVSPTRFATHCDIHVVITFENETDAVLFKLQWES